MRYSSPAALALSSLLAQQVACAPATTQAESALPLVIWHGLGDNYQSDGIKSVGEIYKKIYPNAYIHNIALDESASSDRSATFFGSVHTQLSTVCTQLSSIPELTDGFHALGFSQGGQFLRAYIQTCASGPPIHTLITFGSQHNGIAKFGECKPTDWVCKSAFGLLKANAWSEYVQSHVVPAQYYRDPNDFEKFLDKSGWLADVNNERFEKNETYRERLGGLRGKFVMYMFEEDETVVPKESSWFAEVVESDGEGDRGVDSGIASGDGKKKRKVIWLRERKMYKEDWLGLKQLDEKKKLVFLKAPGPHMHISDKILKEAFTKYLGPANNSNSDIESTASESSSTSPDDSTPTQDTKQTLKDELYELAEEVSQARFRKQNILPGFRVDDEAVDA